MPLENQRTTAATNPLLSNELPDFPALRSEHALPAVEARLDAYRALIDEIESGAAPPTAATIEREVRVDDALALTWSTISHLHGVVNTRAWREAYSACLEPITAFFSARGQNRAVHDCWRAAAASDDLDRWPAAFRRMVEEELFDFRQSGVDLPPGDRERFVDISLRLSRLGNDFGLHLLDATEGWFEDFDDESGLAGLPQSERDTLAQRARDAGVGGWRADLTGPCYRAVVTYADDRELRRRFYLAHCTRASSQGPRAGRFDNEPVVAEMLSLRHEEALLLGYDNAAELRLSRRMAPDVATVEAFLDDLAMRARPAAEQQLAELTDFARNRGGPDVLEPWDIGYYAERMREQRLGLSQDKLKPWFELERVLAALFGLAERLFGIRFERDDSVPTWHDDVRFYRVAGGDVAASGLYTDLYARAGKQGGAWMDVCRQRMRLGDGPARPPVAYLTCNFAAPAPGRPSLLTHDDVVTLFHEFGHTLHHLLTRVDWPPVAGIAGVEWDAVELPSQLLEGWVWEPDFLRGFARHHETGEPLPDEWIAALDADRKFLGAMALLRQIEFALTDLELHRGPVADPNAIARQVHQRVGVTPLPDCNRFLMSFSHLFDGGYAAGYYSYLWAERLARDAFELFRERGLADRATGRRLLDQVLAVGGSRPMHESWLAFRGREPRLEPLLDSYGVAA